MPLPKISPHSHAINHHGQHKPEKPSHAKASRNFKYPVKSTYDPALNDTKRLFDARGYHLNLSRNQSLALVGLVFVGAALQTASAVCNDPSRLDVSRVVGSGDRYSPTRGCVWDGGPSGWCAPLVEDCYSPHDPALVCSGTYDVISHVRAANVICGYATESYVASSWQLEEVTCWYGWNKCKQYKQSYWIAYRQSNNPLIGNLYSQTAHLRNPPLGSTGIVHSQKSCGGSSSGFVVGDTGAQIVAPATISDEDMLAQTAEISRYCTILNTPISFTVDPVPLPTTEATTEVTTPTTEITTPTDESTPSGSVTDNPTTETTVPPTNATEVTEVTELPTHISNITNDSTVVTPSIPSAVPTEVLPTADIENITLTDGFSSDGDEVGNGIAGGIVSGAVALGAAIGVGAGAIYLKRKKDQAPTNLPPVKFNVQTTSVEIIDQTAVSPA